MASLLVVEDNPVNMELVVDLLEARGHAVQQVSSAEEAIAAANRLKPDLILMDVSLPGMDGLSATKVLKHTPATTLIPVLALTAHAMQGDADKATAAGCAGYITKPIDTRTFVDTVESYLAGGS